MGRYMQMELATIITPNKKLFILPILGLIIGLYPPIFIFPVNFVAEDLLGIYETHLSIGAWWALFSIPIFAVYDFVLILYLVFSLKYKGKPILLMLSIFTVQILLIFKELGAFG